MTMGRGRVDEVVAQTQVRTVVLKMTPTGHHCDGCSRRIRCTILKIHGVQQVTVDSGKNQITVKGTMKIDGFAEYVSRKIGRHVEVVQPEPERTCNGQAWCLCNQCRYGIICRLPMVPLAPPPHQSAPSYENPNGCSVM